MHAKLSERKQTVFKNPSLDTWAVILGLILAALVRFGVVKHLPW
jgi:hypothetical protein